MKNIIIATLSAFSVLTNSSVMLAGQIEFPSAHLSRNHENVENLATEIKKITQNEKWILRNGKFSMDEFWIKMDEPDLDDAELSIKKDISVSAGGIIGKENSDNQTIEDIQTYVRLRLNGFSPEFSENSIFTETGFEWNGLHVDKSLFSSGVPLPEWIVDFANVPDDSEVLYFDDALVRRFVILNEDIIIGEIPIDIRDATMNKLRKKALTDAFSSVEKVNGERDKTYFLRVAKWLYEKKGIRWISPYEIPSLNEF